MASNYWGAPRTTRDLSSKSELADAFSADGKTIYGIRSVADHVELFPMSVAGAIEKTIGALGREYLPGSAFTPTYPLSLTPDGKWMASASPTAQARARPTCG